MRWNYVNSEVYFRKSAIETIKFLAPQISIRAIDAETLYTMSI